MKKFSFENLRNHSKKTSADISIRESHEYIARAFDDFDDFIVEIENQPISPRKNVTMMLACKLFNHIYSGIILAENGLIVDSILCGRNALETIAFHWLIQVDESAINEYMNDEVPRPVEVRKRLEKSGVDINQIRDIYSSDSRITHVGRDGERINTKWLTPSQGKLFFGGAFLPKDQEHMFEYLSALLYLFQTKPSLK